MGMEARNKLVHVGRLPADKDWAKKRTLLEDPEERYGFFTSIRDLLWILYYNRGFDWALNHLSEQAQQETGQIRTIILSE